MSKIRKNNEIKFDDKRIKQLPTCQDNCKCREKILIKEGILKFSLQFWKPYSFVVLPRMHFSNWSHQFKCFKVLLFCHLILKTAYQTFPFYSQCFSNEVLLEKMK